MIPNTTPPAPDHARALLDADLDAAINAACEVLDAADEALDAACEVLDAADEALDAARDATRAAAYAKILAADVTHDLARVPHIDAFTATVAAARARYEGATTP